jgi:hypothetical protein
MIPSSGCPPWRPDHPRTLPRTGSPTPPRGTLPRLVVPIRSLKVSQERDSFFLPLPEAAVKTVPLMPDPDYKWLSDEAWRARNDALFARP